MKPSIWQMSCSFTSQDVLSGRLEQQSLESRAPRLGLAKRLKLGAGRKLRGRIKSGPGREHLDHSGEEGAPGP